MNAPVGSQLDEIILIEQGRAWTDEAHVAFEDAQKLRQLIQTRAPKEVSYRGKIAIWITYQVGGKLWRINPHGPKFGHLEFAVALADSARPVNHGARRGKLDRSGHGKQRHRECSDSYGGQSKIEQPLRSFVGSSIHDLLHRGACQNLEVTDRFIRSSCC